MDVQAIALAIAQDYEPQLGPPSLISDSSILTVLLAELRAGVHLEPACLVAGVHVDTVRKWLKRGETDDSGPYRQLVRAVNLARGAVESDVTKCIIAAGKLPQYWTAAATYLERTHPARWGKPSDRQDRQTAAIEVHVHGIERTRVLVGVTTHVTSESKQRVLSNELDGDTLIEGQSGDSALALGAVVRTHQGAAARGSAGGPTGGRGSAQTHGITNTEKNPSVFSLSSFLSSSPSLVPATTVAEVVRTEQQETQKPLLTEASSTSTSKKKRVRSPGLQNPAALRRQALLHAAAKRLRRKRATAKRLRDAERWEAGKTSKQQKAAKALAAQEAALPNMSVIPE